MVVLCPRGSICRRKAALETSHRRGKCGAHSLRSRGIRKHHVSKHKRQRDEGENRGRGRGVLHPVLENSHEPSKADRWSVPVL